MQVSPVQLLLLLLLSRASERSFTWSNCCCRCGCRYIFISCLYCADARRQQQTLRTTRGPGSPDSYCHYFRGRVPRRICILAHFPPRKSNA